MKLIQTKSKHRRFWPDNTCLRLFLLALSFPCSCFASLWSFAHFGGEWASAFAFPIPPDSQIVDTSYEYIGLYHLKTNLYTNSASPEELREWFVESGVYMTPILNMGGTSFIDYEGYYGIPVPEGSYRFSSLQEFHMYASIFTHAWWEDMLPTCQDIRVYKEAAFALIDYPDLALSTDLSLFTITTCWAAN